MLKANIYCTRTNWYTNVSTALTDRHITTKSSSCMFSRPRLFHQLQIFCTSYKPFVFMNSWICISVRCCTVVYFHFCILWRVFWGRSYQQLHTSSVRPDCPETGKKGADSTALHKYTNTQKHKYKDTNKHKIYRWQKLFIKLTQK